MVQKVHRYCSRHFIWFDWLYNIVFYVPLHFFKTACLYWNEMKIFNWILKNIIAPSATTFDQMKELGCGVKDFWEQSSIWSLLITRVFEPPPSLVIRFNIFCWLPLSFVVSIISKTPFDIETSLNILCNVWIAVHVYCFPKPG